MPYYFKKQKAWNSRKILQFSLALLVLFIGIAILFSWLFIRYQKGKPTDTAPSDTNISTEQEHSTEIAHCLLTFDFSGVERFVLVQTNPVKKTVTVVPIPSTLADHDGCTLANALHRHGAPLVTEIIADTLSLPVKHYFSFTPANVEDFLVTLDNGVLFNVPEKVSYTDENGAKITLSAGEHRLSAGQVRTLLSYTGWKKAANRSNLAADLVVALINQYLLEGRSLSGYFSALSNYSTSGIRIDNFNDYQSALTLLAMNNNGSICRRVDLPGAKENGFFSPNLESFRTKSGLYF